VDRVVLGWKHRWMHCNFFKCSYKLLLSIVSPLSVLCTPSIVRGSLHLLGSILTPLVDLRNTSLSPLAPSGSKQGILHQIDPPLASTWGAGRRSSGSLDLWVDRDRRSCVRWNKLAFPNGCHHESLTCL